MLIFENGSQFGKFVDLAEEWRFCYALLPDFTAWRLLV